MIHPPKQDASQTTTNRNPHDSDFNRNALAAGRRVTVTTAPALGPNLDSLPVSDKIKALIVQGCDPDDPGHYASRSEAYWAVICAMVRAGCTDDRRDQADGREAPQADRGRQAAVDVAAAPFGRSAGGLGEGPWLAGDVA